MKKFIFVFFFSLIINFSNLANSASLGWGLSEMRCSKVLESRGVDYWDEWIFMNASGFLSGINAAYNATHGYGKDLSRYDDDFLIAFLYNECSRDKNSVLGVMYIKFFNTLPNAK